MTHSVTPPSQFSTTEDTPPEPRPSRLSAGTSLAVIRSASELDLLEREWDRLLDSCEYATPFMSWEWYRHWWGHYGQGHRVSAAVLRDTDGELVGVIPLMSLPKSPLTPRELRYLGSYRSSGIGYTDFLLRPGFEDVGLDLFASELAGDASWDRIRLTRLRADSPNLARLCRAATANNMRVEVREDTWGRIAPLPDSYEDYLKTLGTESRRQLRRRTDRLFRSHRAAFKVLQSEAEVRDSISWFMRHKRTRLHEKREWTRLDHPGYADFLLDFCLGMLRKKRLRIFALEVDGKLACCQPSLATGDTVTFWYAAYDPAYQSDRVNDVCTGLSLRACIDEGFKVADYMQSEHPHKRHYAKERQQVVRVDIYRPRLRSLMLEGMTHLAAPVWYGVRGMLPHGVLGRVSRLLKRDIAPTRGKSQPADAD